MADPIVTITNGVPTSSSPASGTITTLGQTLVDGANLTLGATTDVAVAAGAAGTINAHLRSLSRDLVGGIVLQTGANVIGAVTQSGTWTVSGTIAATQSGTWTVQPGNTANTTPWLFTMSQGGNAAIVTAAGAQKVDGSAVTQPVSLASTTITGTVGVTQSTSPWVVSLASTTITGTVAATQSGTWTVNPTTVGTWGLAASTQNVAVPTNGQLVQGQFNTTPTTIATGNISPLQLDASGNLLVNIKAGGAAGGTASTFGAAFPSTGTAVGVMNNAGTAMTNMAVDASGNLKVNIVAGGAAGGTSSTIGAAMPTTATVAMGSVTTAAPTYTTATANSLSLNTAGGLRVDGSGVTQPVSGTFWQTTQPVSLASTTITGSVTVAQATAANLNATVTGTVAATQSGAWTVNPTTIGNWGLSSSTFNTATPTNGQLVEGQYNSAQTAMTSGNSSPLQMDKAGRLLAVAALRTLKGVQKTSISVATETTVVTAGAAGVFNDVYAFVCTNKSATNVFVDFRDATAGTVRMTLAVPASDTRGFTVPVDSAMVQAVAANNWTATVSAAVSSIEISALYASNI